MDSYKAIEERFNKQGRGSENNERKPNLCSDFSVELSKGSRMIYKKSDVNSISIEHDGNQHVNELKDFLNKQIKITPVDIDLPAYICASYNLNVNGNGVYVQKINDEINNEMSKLKTNSFMFEDTYNLFIRGYVQAIINSRRNKEITEEKFKLESHFLKQAVTKQIRLFADFDNFSFVSKGWVGATHRIDKSYYSLFCIPSDDRESFNEYIQHITSLQFKYILTYYDSWIEDCSESDDKQRFIVEMFNLDIGTEAKYFLILHMEYCSDSLESFLTSETYCNQNSALRWSLVRQILETINYFHSKGVPLTNIHSKNIYIIGTPEDYRVKIRIRDYESGKEKTMKDDIYDFAHIFFEIWHPLEDGKDIVFQNLLESNVFKEWSVHFHYPARFLQIIYEELDKIQDDATGSLVKNLINLTIDTNIKRDSNICLLVSCFDRGRLNLNDYEGRILDAMFSKNGKSNFGFYQNYEVKSQEGYSTFKLQALHLWYELCKASGADIVFSLFSSSDLIKRADYNKNNYLIMDKEGHVYSINLNDNQLVHYTKEQYKKELTQSKVSENINNRVTMVNSDRQEGKKSKLKKHRGDETSCYKSYKYAYTCSPLGFKNYSKKPASNNDIFCYEEILFVTKYTQNVFASPLTILRDFLTKFDVLRSLSLQVQVYCPNPDSFLYNASNKNSKNDDIFPMYFSQLLKDATEIFNRYTHNISTEMSDMNVIRILLSRNSEINIASAMVVIEDDMIVIKLSVDIKAINIREIPDGGKKVTVYVTRKNRNKFMDVGKYFRMQGHSCEVNIVDRLPTPSNDAGYSTAFHHSELCIVHPNIDRLVQEYLSKTSNKQNR